MSIFGHRRNLQWVLSPTCDFVDVDTLFHNSRLIAFLSGDLITMPLGVQGQKRWIASWVGQIFLFLIFVSPMKQRITMKENLTLVICTCGSVVVFGRPDEFEGGSTFAVLAVTRSSFSVSDFWDDEHV